MAMERARWAFETQNEGNKRDLIVSHVNNLKVQYGNGVSTKCIFYNATGDPVVLTLVHDWNGHIGSAPYPTVIENGQWGGFLHVHPEGAATGSVGAAVYRGKNLNGDQCDWMMTWYNPWSRASNNNHVYTEIRESGHYATNHWNYIYGLLADSGLRDRDTWGGCVSSITTEAGTTALVEAIMTQEGA